MSGAFGFGSLAFTGVVGRRLLYPSYVQDYLDRVTAADVAAGDTSGLELGVTDGINNFIEDLVSDTYLGVSGGVIAQPASVIKASPIMAGARTLNGALQPLVGTAPTRFNFVAGDYNRKTGLGPGATNTNKFLNSNFAPNMLPQNSIHCATYCSTIASAASALMGCRGNLNQAGDVLILGNATSGDAPFRLNCPAGVPNAGTRGTSVTGLIAASRSVASSLVSRVSGTNQTISDTSTAPVAESIYVFARNNRNTMDASTTARLAFYSIGESIDLALLDARVTALINAFAAAIP